MFPTEIKIVKEGIYEPRHVFNCDESGLFWNEISNMTCIYKDAKQASGFKVWKGRPTLVLCGNATGHTIYDQAWLSYVLV
jgi:hypothetical protein